jgi:hypothetical protein
MRELPTVIHAGEQVFAEGVEYANFRDTMRIIDALDEAEGTE